MSVRDNVRLFPAVVFSRSICSARSGRIDETLSFRPNLFAWIHNYTVSERSRLCISCSREEQSEKYFVVLGNKRFHPEEHVHVREHVFLEIVGSRLHTNL